jgi:hypothetical protein
VCIIEVGCFEAKRKKTPKKTNKKKTNKKKTNKKKTKSTRVPSDNPSKSLTRVIHFAVMIPGSPSRYDDILSNGKIACSQHIPSNAPCCRTLPTGIESTLVSTQ